MTLLANLLMGISITSTNNILLIALMKERMIRGNNLRLAINETVSDRLRHILMVALIGSLRLLPTALSTGMGSEIQKPLAIMIVDGILICIILSFAVLPQMRIGEITDRKRDREKRHITGGFGFTCH